MRRWTYTRSPWSTLPIRKLTGNRSIPTNPCNPGYGTTVNESTWKPLVTEAINERRKAYSFKTEFLNLWQGSQACWLPPDKWRACGMTINEADLHGCKAWAGTDCAFKADLWGYTLAVEKDDIVYLLPRAFSPRISRRTQEQDRPRSVSVVGGTRAYHLDGWNVADPVAVRAKMVEDAKNFNIVELGFDPAKGFEESRQILERDHNFITVEVPQRPQYLGPATVRVERAVLEGTRSGIHISPDLQLVYRELYQQRDASGSDDLQGERLQSDRHSNGHAHCDQPIHRQRHGQRAANLLLVPYLQCGNQSRYMDDGTACFLRRADSDL